MDVLEPLSMQDLFQGLSSTSILDSGFPDEENKDPLLDYLAQCFPDMLTQSFSHLSSLPLDASDILLSIQDEDYQDIGENIVDAEFTPSKPEDHFSPIKKLCPDHIDLLAGPLLDGDDEEDFKTQGNIDPPPPYQQGSIKSCPLVKPTGIALNTSPTTCKAPNSNKPLVAYVKPVPKAAAIPEPTVSVASPDKTSLRKVINTVRVEEESLEEVDIETVDDDELNGRSGAEVLSAMLADIGCQAARVRVVPPKLNAEFILEPPVIDYKPQSEKIHTGGESLITTKAAAPTTQSFPLLVKPSSKLKEKEHSPSSVVEKIKQSAIAPRSSILIPHQGPPTQSRGKPGKTEVPKVVKSKASTAPSISLSLYDARTLDHDYCNITSSKTPATIVKQENQTNNSTLGAENECVVLCSLKPSTSSDSCVDVLQSDLLETETTAIDVPMSEPSQELVTTVVKTEQESSQAFCSWDSSRSPSPCSQNGYQKSGSRKRSSCSPSSVSSHSVYRSRSRSSSHGRQGRSQTRHFRKQSRGRSRSRQSIKRNRYTYSRSSSQSSCSSRSRSPSLSRSRTRTCSQSRSRRQSWDYKRTYNRAPVASYNWAQDKRRYDEKNQEIEERRVVYVGRLPDGTTKNDLRHRFGCFGPIQEVSLHFRDSGHNYGFVTFSYKRDAYQAVEHGNDDPSKPKFDLSFGGRRQFCRQRYADLDSQYNNYSVQRPAPANDFDSLLLAAKLKQKKY